MLASSVISVPSLVMAGVFLSFCSFLRARGGALAFAVLLQHQRARIGDHHAGIAVDDQPVVLLDQGGGAGHADHRRDIERTRDDGGVRVLAADVGHKADEGAVAELQHVGRRDIVRDDNHLRLEFVLAAFGLGQHLLGAQQHLEHALGHLLDVGLALAQVRVFDFVELRRQLVDLGQQRPFGVVVAVRMMSSGASEIIGSDRISACTSMNAPSSSAHPWAAHSTGFAVPCARRPAPAAGA
jgi:hypothetical protein